MSNPFAPPGPQPSPGPFGPPQPPQGPFGPPQAPQGPFGPPQAPQGQFAPPVPQGMYGGPGQTWAPQPQQPYAPPPPRPGNGLAITAIVLSGLALLSVLAMAAFFFVGPVGSGGWIVSGEVTPIDRGVTDMELEDALVASLEDDGSYVDELECPPRSQVGQGLVTVCHGSVDGWDWTGVVVFEDDAGAFVVTSY